MRERDQSGISQKQADVASETPAEVFKHKTLNLDTLVSVGDEIVFFKPTEEEFDSLMNVHGEESGLYEVESDFSHYANEVGKRLEGTKTKISFATQRIIKIIAFDQTVSHLDRLDNGSNEYGIIFNSSKHEPRVEFGVWTDVGILEVVKERNK